MKDYVGAVKAGATNEQLNIAAGTTGRDYVGAVNAGATNEQFNQYKSKPKKEDAYTPLATKIAEDEGGIINTLKEPFMKQVQSTKEGLRDIVGGGLEGIAEDVIQPIFMSPTNPISQLFPQQVAGGIDVLKEAGQGLAFDPQSLNYKLGKVAGPMVNIGGAAGKARQASKRIAGINDAVVDFARRKGIDDDELKAMLQGVNPIEHAQTVANRVKGGGVGITKQALLDSDDRITQFHRNAQQRAMDVENVAGTKNVEAIDDITSKNFGEMVSEVRNMNVGVKVDNVLEGIDTKQILGGKDAPAKVLLNDMDAIFKENPTQNLSDLLLMREEVNSMLNTAKGTSRFMLKKAKTNLDSIIKGNTPEPIGDLVSSTVDGYRVSKQNLTMADLIETSKNQDGIINYGELARKIAKDDNINTYQSKAVVNMLEQFEKKYNNDWRVMGGTAGSNTKEGVLGLQSEILSPLKALFVRWGEYGNNVAMQKLVAKALDKSKTPFSFASKIAGDKRVPKEIRDIFRSNLKAARDAAKGKPTTPKKNIITEDPLSDIGSNSRGNFNID